MRAADKAAAAAGIPSLLLMETAGRKVAKDAIEHFPEAKQVLILCGKGNNGGDGYVVARYLLLARKTVQVLATDAPGSSESQSMRAAYLAHEQAQLKPLDITTLDDALTNSQLIIDGLFGSGLSRPLTGLAVKIVTTANHSKLPILSIDVPSGILADSSQIPGSHIQASRTLQLAGAKIASAFYPARSAFGACQLVDIGIPASLLDKHGSVQLLDKAASKLALPTRTAQSHKYQVGTVLVIAGSQNYQGAAELACRAALRAGAGLVTLVSATRPTNSWPEIIFQPLDWSHDALGQIKALDAKRQQVRVIGPGLAAKANDKLPQLIQQSPAATVLDAAALQANEAWFAAVRQQGNCVITPHVGEAAKLLGVASKEIEAEPLLAAKELAQKTQAIVVLKGPTTVIATADGKLAVSTAGHPGMATAGAGDVLAGLIGAWLCAANDIYERVCAAVFVHGSAGELAAKKQGDGLTAGDLIEAIPQAWSEIAHGRLPL